MAKVLPVLVVLIVIILAPAIIFSPVFEIKNLTFEKQQDCANEQELKDNFRLIGKNLFSISQESLEKDLKNHFDCAEFVSLKKQWPSTLGIKIEVKQPVLKIAGTDLYLTNSALVTDNTKNTDLPTIFLPEGTTTPIVNQHLTDRAVLSAVKIASLLQKSDFTAANVRIINSQDIAVYNRQSFVVIFSLEKSIEDQINSLQQIVALTKIDGSKITKIDLRFDKPIVE